MTLSPDLIKKIMSILSATTEVINGCAEKIEQYNDRIAQFCDNNSNKDNEILPTVIDEHLEILKMDDIKKICQAHRPSHADCVPAYLLKGKNHYIMVLTFAKGRNILSSESNKLITIDAEYISREVDALFSNNQTIILK